MKKLNALLLLLFSLSFFINAFAQTMPLVYSVENTGADYPVPYLPSLSQLPSISYLPNPFEWADGRGIIKHYSDWEYRRAEIGAQIQNYEIGKKPPRPDSITASYSAGVLTVNITVNGKTLKMTSQVILPSGAGPFPAVIGIMSPSGSIPESIFKNRKIAEIAYNINQVTTYGNPKNTDPYYRLYPDLNITNTGQYSAWAWGVSRIIDGLELVKNDLPIDLKHLAVTGCSYAGKLALFAGAFDERIALTIAQESGGGGATSWRYSHYLSTSGTSVENIDNTDYNWFKDDMHKFAGDNVYRLPEDHHELMAMVAPRALYVTANPKYTWLSNPSCYVASEACKQVYKDLGIPDRFGYSIVGGHLHCQVPASQIPEITAFVDKFLLGKDTVDTDSIADSPYSFSLKNWIPWSNPVLSAGKSYFGKASLVSPANFSAGLDTNVTVKWHSVKDAEKYYVELYLDPTLQKIEKIDSTSDTAAVFTGLIQGFKYYWRVQVKSAAGVGPWSDVWNFITLIPLPAVPPRLISVFPYQGRQGYFTFTWTNVKNASQYLIQTSDSSDFNKIFTSASTYDTVKILWGFADVHKYYWRVRASNITASGPWSKVKTFSTLPAPTDLSLQKTSANEVTLTWTNNSAVEDGSVIERKKSSDTSFTVLDTLKGSGSSYVDKNFEPGQSYTYRVCAYKDSVESDYSNEVTLLITGVKKKAGIPDEYSLSQNYPNPFNPVTKIRYSIPNVGTHRYASVRINVYNVLGRKISTLVNKKQRPGNYEVTFDGSRFSSGIYFYRIQAGSFVETKKLILLK